MKSSKEHSATHRTVIIAGAANIVVGLAKLAAGIISGSSAMLLIREEIESRPGVNALLELRTMHMGPDSPVGRIWLSYVPLLAR